MKASERNAKSPSARTGRFATLGRPFAFEGSGAPSRPLRLCLFCALLITVAVAALPAWASAAYVKASPEVLCTAAGSAAGQCGEIHGVAVDQSNGNIYLLDPGGPRRIEEFSASGEFVRAFGVNVGGTGVNVCTTTCQQGSTTGSGAIGTGARGIAVDSTTHIVYAVTGATKVAYYEGDGTFLGEFEGDTNTSPPAPAKLSTSGIAIDESSSQHYLYVASGTVIDKFKVPVASGGTVTSVPAYECQITGKAPGEQSSSECDAAGSQDGAFNGVSFAGQTGGNLAVDSAGNVYAAEETARGVVSEFSPTGAFVRAISVPAPVAVAAATPEHLFVVGEAGTSAGGTQLQERETSTGTVLTEITLQGPSVATATYRLASGLKGRLYAGGTRPLKTAWVFREVVEIVPAVEIEPATDASSTSVQLNGTVTVPTSEGEAVPTQYWFEYSANGGITWTAEAERSAGETPGTVTVSQQLSGLLANTSYQARLCATTVVGSRCENTKVTAASSPIGFTTSTARPRVEEVQASFATETSVELEASVNPNGSATSYRFEWGTSVLYGHKVPAEFEPLAGSGHESTRATATLTGLSPGSVYYYRVVATNPVGSTSVAQEAETLNACGLTDRRCLELVSRADKGPVARPGKSTLGTGVPPQLQAAPGGSALAYNVEYGYPDASSGYEPVYLARRGADGWASEQLNPPILGPPLEGVGSATSGATQALSADLGCTIVQSTEALAVGAPATIVEAGNTNLFVRDNASGSYETITTLPPVRASLETEVTGYIVVGVSPDCGRGVFRTVYRYPGIPAIGGATARQLYEWDHGTIRNVAIVPGPGGISEPVPTESTPGSLPGSLSEITNSWRAVTEDGSRSIFTATSRFGGDLGKQAIFLRDTDDPAVLAGTAPAVDISQSETATANNGNSHYWTASTDGTRIFFTARYGLAADGSSSGSAVCSNAASGSSTGTSGEGCDLYEYDLEKPAGERLSDLSPDLTDPEGAGVVGVLDASESGEYVYFAARGRLGAAGRTEAESLASSTYNVYLAHSGSTTLVGMIGEAETGEGGQALVANMGNTPWTSQASPDGRFLVFESSVGVSGGAPMSYLFSADEGATVCVSCRHDGEHPFPATGANANALVSPVVNGEDRIFRPAVLTDGGRLYFYSADPLATAAVEGRRNLYQWEHGQVSLIATEPEGIPKDPSQMFPLVNFFGGASADGDDVYFASPSALIGSDKDEGWDVYDARVGGGFPEPTAPSPCAADAEGSCNGTPASSSPPVTPSTSGFSGPGNPKAEAKTKKHHKKKHHKKKHHKRHGKKKHQKKAGKTGRANGDRRAGK